MRTSFQNLYAIETAVRGLRSFSNDVGMRLLGVKQAAGRREARRLSASCQFSPAEGPASALGPLPAGAAQRGSLQVMHATSKKKKAAEAEAAAAAAAAPPVIQAPTSGFMVASRLSRLQKPVEKPSDGMCFKCRPTGGEVCCEGCRGGGVLARGGYQTRNPVKLSTILGSKWTAHERTFGWRHFRVLNRKNEGDKVVFVEARCYRAQGQCPGSAYAVRRCPQRSRELKQAPLSIMQATCDAEVRFWVNLQNLRDRDRWSCGWVRGWGNVRSSPVERADIRALDIGEGLTGGTCRTCSGTGKTKCPICSTPDGVLSVV